MSKTLDQQVAATLRGTSFYADATGGGLRQSSHRIWWWLLSFLLIAFVLALSVGRIVIHPFDALALLLGLSHPPALGTDAATAQTVIHSLRLPRALIAVLLGAGLGVAGAVLQGVLRNPLGGPQNVGLLAGAGAGGTLALLLAASPLGVVAAAFVGGLTAMACVLWLARVQGQVTVLSLVLSGVVVSSLFTAAIALLQYVSDPERQLPNLVFWLMGSLAASSPAKVWLAFGFIVPPVILLWGLAGRLDVLSSGDVESLSLGVKPQKLRLTAICATALICSVVVACGGLVAWVGLVVPHIARLLVGSSMRLLLPASALVGASVLLAVDTLCRSMTAAEIPLGAVTAIFGAPIFAWLLKRQLSSGLV